MASTEKQKKAVQDFYDRNYRIPVVFPKDTKERLERFANGKSNQAFIKEIVLAKLDELERILGTGKTE